MPTFSRMTLLFAALAFIGAFAIVYLQKNNAEYIDSYYHYNVAANIVQGDGFISDYYWIYINAKDSLPAPAYLYWMPGTSFVAAAGMALFGLGYAGAQVGFALCLWGASLLGYALGWRLGGTRRHAWLAGLLVIVYGPNISFWPHTDTVAPYALIGGVALWAMGMGITAQKGNWRWWLLAGVMAAGGHLLRNDGLLLVLTAWSVLIWPFDRSRYGSRMVWGVIFTLAYIVVMSPWFMRMNGEIGAPIASDGLLTVTMYEYNEIFSYPAEPQRGLNADTMDDLIQVRLDSFFAQDGMLLRILSYNGAFIFTLPLLLALFKRWNEPFIRPLWIFALGVHLAFTLVFPLPALFNSYLHAAVAFVPAWAALGLVGLDDIIDWIGKRRRRWNVRTAKRFYSVVFSVMFVVISFVILPGERARIEYLPLLEQTVPADARIMYSLPGEIHYYMGNVTTKLPHSSLETINAVAQLYDMDYVLVRDDAAPENMLFETPDDVPDFLTAIPFDVEGFFLYRFVRP